MHYHDFFKLTPTQQLTLLIAMHVRNEQLNELFDDKD